MARDMDGLADVVAMLVKSAVAPVFERLAVAEAKVVALTGIDAAVTGLRERIVVVETKAAMPMPVPAMDGLSERVVALESKSLGPPPVAEDAVADIRRRVEALEQKPAPEPVTADLSGLRDRLTVIETKASGLELRLSSPDPLTPAIDRTERTVAELSKDLGILRERVAVVEVKGQMPGPPGEPGAPGKDGLNGKDGAAGLSFEGVYQEGQTYEKGAFVTWAGSGWHCNGATTTKPGEGSKDWTLAIKRGRDGKDGKDAMTLPVVSVGAR